MISGWKLDPQNLEEKNFAEAIERLNCNAEILYDRATKDLNNKLALINKWIQNNKSDINAYLIEGIYNLYQTVILPKRPNLSSYTSGWHQVDKILLTDLETIYDVLKNPNQQNVDSLHKRSEKPRFNMNADAAQELGQTLLVSSLALILATGLVMVPICVLAPMLMIPVAATLMLIAIGMGIAGGNIRLGDDSKVSSEEIAIKGVHNRMFTLFNNLNKNEHYSKNEIQLNYAV